MGTDIDAALDEIYYGRHCRLNGGIPASLGARTSYDIKYAHQRLLKRQAAERLELERQEKKKAAREHAVECAARRSRAQVKVDLQVQVFERRRRRAANKVSLWQEEGWEAWWSLLQLAARKWWIQQADYNETGDGADTVRYLLLQTHLKELALEHGFSEKTGKAVAAAIFINGFVSWSLVAKDRCTFGA
jgi:hypothetical protein